MSLTEDEYWNLNIYDENEEKANGLYWRLLEEDIEDLRQNIIRPVALCKIAEQIENPKLKEQFKNKIKESYSIELIQKTDTTLFSEAEIKQMILEEIEQKKEEFNNTRSRKTISDLIYIIQNVKEQEWVNNEINSLLQSCFVDLEWKPEDRNTLQSYKRMVFEDISNKELKMQMIKKYSNNLSKEMSKLIEFESNPEGEMMRQAVYNNSRMKPFSGEIGTQIIPEDITREEVIQMFQPGNEKTLPGLEFKKNSICLRGENEGNYRLEYRIPNGTVDYTTWVDNIRLIGKMVEVSKTLGDIVSGKVEPTDKQLQMLSDKETLKDSTLSLEEKLYVLMDILFDDDKTKQIYTNRFYALEQAISRDYAKDQQIYQPSGGISDRSFGTMDFQRQYISTLEKQYGYLEFSDDKEQEYSDNERY